MASDLDAARAAAALLHAMADGPAYPPDLPDAGEEGCCMGGAVMGPQRCTCWKPVYDLGQQEPKPGYAGMRTSMCHDCAYRPGSPERQGDDRYQGDAGFLDLIVETGEKFFCHQGIRRIVKWVHEPTGTEVEAFPGDYQPPRLSGVPYKADGSPGELCARWAARRLNHVWREAQGA